MITFARLTILLLSLRKVVITGGPSTGKTAVIENLEKKGYTCVQELIRSMTASEKNGRDLTINPIVSVKDPKKFNTELLHGRIEQYKSTKDSTAELVFFDRGIPDVLAYMHCFGQDYDKNFEQACQTYRYDKVFLMPPWKEIYAVDDERFESFDESVQIYECLNKTYTDFGYDVALIPKASIEERSEYILDFLDLG